jgi:hypothetical protein
MFPLLPKRTLPNYNKKSEGAQKQPVRPFVCFLLLNSMVEPITVRASRRVGDILKCVPESGTVQTNFSSIFKSICHLTDSHIRLFLHIFSVYFGCQLRIALR